jgi:hypothetical protein
MTIPAKCPPKGTKPGKGWVACEQIREGGGIPVALIQGDQAVFVAAEKKEERNDTPA